MASDPKNVRLNVLIKLQEALDEEAILEEQILPLMHHFADRFTDRMVEINNLLVLHDHPLIDYGADIARITRKEPKPDKNRHENGKSTKKPGHGTQSTAKIMSLWSNQDWKAMIKRWEGRLKI
uniref:Uncharacterized protein n=1 Tax=Tanacetum cinerariifolium TaxID=118510 RepID=A0A6L2JIY2_TANCI|nr:hypothetical protein [Tanacetum cinerariifolium]